MAEEKEATPAEVQDWTVTNESGELHRLRRHAASLGLAVTKIPHRSRWFHQYGPYMLTNPWGGYAIVASGLHLEDVEPWLEVHRHKSQQWRPPTAGVQGWCEQPPLMARW